MSDSIIDDIDTTLTGNAKIKVIGVGGAGGNAVQEMIDSQLMGVQFVCANTDLQALSRNKALIKVQLGEKLTKGLGAGANPVVGREAALESINSIRDAIGDADMIFVTAGMGGGTGTGAAPIVAQAAKEMGILTVGVVSKPFYFEGANRLKIAEEGLEELKQYVDSLIVIPNDRLVTLAPKKAKMSMMMKMANEVLFNAVRGISDVIMRDGLINVDFADVRTTMQQTGMALMGTGRASGENRAKEAAIKAISSPLLEDVSLESAKAILYNITTNGDITMDEVKEIGNEIHDASSTDKNINIIFGIVFDEAMGDELQVTVIATGIEPHPVIVDEGLPLRDNVTPFRSVNRQQVEGSSPRVARMKQSATVGSEDPGEELPQQNGFSQYGAVSGNNYGGIKQTSFKPRTSAGNPANSHMPGKDVYTYTDEELEIPTFLRTNAD